MKKFYLFAGLWVALFSVKAQNVATFDDVELETNSYWNGSDGSGGFTSGGFYFPNDYDAAGGSWSGFAISNMKDTTTPGWTNQYSAITASGVNGSENYGVAYFWDKSSLDFENPVLLTGFYITNSTYACLSMKDGDGFSKKFGGEDGTDPDYFKLIVSGTDIYGGATDTIEFLLADFTSDNPEDDYIVDNWEWVDLSGLGVVGSIYFWFESSDMSNGYINTPTYFCMDDFNGASPENSNVLSEADFEDVGIETESYYNGADGAGSIISGGFTFSNSYADFETYTYWEGFATSTMTDNLTEGYSNEFSAITGTGALETSTYAVSYAPSGSEINFEKTTVSGFYITNSTYAYYSMLNGDGFAKKFGGEDRTDEDWFKLTVYGVSETGDTTGTVEYYLADFRAENSSEDYIVNDWEWLDLSSLGEITKLRLSLSSSDVGDWGMNTPAYFCIDQLNHQDLAPVIVNPVATIEEATYPDNLYYVSLDSVFTDPDNDDSEMVFELENIDNPGLLSGTVSEGITPEETTMLLSLTITSGMTGTANITISATSNGKKVYHTFEMVVSVPVSSGLIPDIENEIKVYPNPVGSYFYVELPASAGQVVLFDISGKIIYQNTVANRPNIKISALQNSPAGIYFLKVKSNTGFKTQKIVKL